MDNTSNAASPKRPRPDMQAVAQGDPQALALAVADLAARLHLRAGSSIRLPTAAVDVALQTGPRAGLLAAAVELCELLSHSPQGRKALRDLRFQPVLEHVERE